MDEELEQKHREKQETIDLYKELLKPPVEVEENEEIESMK